MRPTRAARPARHRALARAVAAAAALLLLAGCGSSSAQPRESPLLVAAAADLQPAFAELGRIYTRQTGRQVTFTFGSSGQLAQQLVNGAPHDVFASASAAYVQDVLDAGRGEASTTVDYAYGRLAVWSPDTAPALQQLAAPQIRRIAIANPQHAPYGTAALEALRSAGIHDRVRDRLVYGENVTDTLRLAASGNADVAIVGLALALASGGSHVPVPAAAHAPLRQRLVVTAPGRRAAAARAFADLVAGPQGRAVLDRHGFARPDAEG